MRINCIFFILFLIKSIGFTQPKEMSQLLKFGNIRDWTLSPDGNEAYFTIQSVKQNISILAGMKKDKKGWSIPYKLSFSGKFSDLEPFVTPDGNRLYFASNRPLSKTEKKAKDYDIWSVERSCHSCEWSEPINIGLPINTTSDEFYPTTSLNNNLYFTSNYNYGKGKDDIFMSEYKDGIYHQPVSLSEKINSVGYEFNSYIARDESYIIFSGYERTDGVGNGDLYISFNKKKQWTKAINLGPFINSTSLDYCPFYNPNDQILYFTSNRSNIEIKEFDNLKTIISKLSAYENGTSRIYKTKLNLDSLRQQSLSFSENISVTDLVDHHVHVMSPSLIKLWKSMGIPFSKPDAAYADMDSIFARLGSNRVKLISMAYVYSSSEFGTQECNIKECVEEENNYLAAAKMKNPDKILAYYGIDPMTEFAIDELKRCHNILKLDGLKMHFNASQIYLSERKYQSKVKEILSYAGKNNIPVLLHFDNSHRRFGMPDLKILSDSILALIPSLHLQIAHLGTSGGFNSRTKHFIDSFLELTAKADHPLNKHRVTFDISAVALDKESDGVQKMDEDGFRELAEYLRKIGFEKLVFGTDYPLYSSQEYLNILIDKVKLTKTEISILLNSKI